LHVSLTHATFGRQVSVSEGQSFLFLFADGSILRRDQKSVTFSCKMNFGRYPFDSHTCNATYSTYSQSSDEVKLTAGITFFGQTELLDLETFMTNFDVGQVTQGCRGYLRHNEEEHSLFLPRYDTQPTQGTLTPTGQ
jgi:hypothetical protein